MKKLVTAAIFTVLMTGTALADTTLKLVEVITSPERTETLKGIVSKFEAANPGTKVEIISLPWSEAFQKFATMVSAGDVPDVMEMPDTWLSLYANNGMLESLEPYLAKWEYTKGLSERTLELGRDVKNTAYMLPYGFYLRAMFYNKKLLAEAGVKEPPKTLEEFADASKKVAALPGKYGYCLRGGPGGLNGWVMFGASMAGSNEFFTKDGTSTFDSPGWVKGLTYVIDLYKNGLAPKDSVNWGFNEIVAGFYSGTCAFLDQDPDALIAIAQRMKPEDFGVMTMPKGLTARPSRPSVSPAGRSCRPPPTRTCRGSWLRRSKGRKAISSGTRRPAHCRCTSRRKKTPSMPASSSRAGSTNWPTRTPCRRKCRPILRNSPSSRIRLSSRHRRKRCSAISRRKIWPSNGLIT